VPRALAASMQQTRGSGVRPRLSELGILLAVQLVRGVGIKPGVSVVGLSTENRISIC
jgi:hypothetical protein